MKKGVSAFFSVVLILLIMISLVSLVYFWSSTSFSQILSGWKPEQISVSKESCLKIENIDTINKKITIRNCGSTKLSEFRVYLDEEIIVSDSRILSSGDIAQISYNINMPSGEHEIFISSNYAESPKTVINIP